MARVTLRLPDELDEAVEDYVGYGSKSEFYRNAAEALLAEETDYEPENDEQTAN
ncbi:ribbon-helix-helix domain-containing protein [Halomicroarcula sp. F13]|uniref:Ribbon-helix-helix domain-containing protein n=1 Tax=Haloarcula rubra TaxID=2487747 RepID=A0AAW4PXM2_9EURY|nr:ribbon-helix-helix domain-containing protein [Halomicroarcula rubra]MBX0325773.1 ribbon-helix-helix domain-containing protein [Halomicroarcula rubra]